MGEEEKIDLDEKGGGKKGFPILLILIVAIISAGITFAVVKFVLTPKPPAQTEVKQEEGKKVEEKVKTEKKASETANDNENSGETTDLAEEGGDTSKGVLSLNEFIVNLNDPIGRRYIKVNMKLELAKKEYEDKIRSDELLIPQIRDVIFLIISSKTYDDLRTVSGKLTLKQEIISKVNEVLSKKFGEDVVTNCFFTDFVIQ